MPGGRGRGRGGPQLNLSGFGHGEALPSATLQPPSLYPVLQQRPTPLRTTEVDEYLLALSQEFRGSIRDSPFYLKPKVVKKDIVRFTDRYKQGSNTDEDKKWQPDWNVMPSELKPSVKRPSQTINGIRPNTSAAKNKDIESIVQKLESKEVSDEKKANEDDDDDFDEEEFEEDDFEDDNDYNMNYYDDGGDNYGDENDGDEGPVF